MTSRLCRYIGGMATTMTVRNVPEHVRRTLAARAARTGRSLQEYLLLELVALADQPTAEELMDAAGLRTAAASTRLDVALLLEDRDADRT